MLNYKCTGRLITSVAQAITFLMVTSFFCTCHSSIRSIKSHIRRCKSLILLTHTRWEKTHMKTDVCTVWTQSSCNAADTDQNLVGEWKEKAYSPRCSVNSSIRDTVIFKYKHTVKVGQYHADRGGNPFNISAFISKTGDFIYTYVFLRKTINSFSIESRDYTISWYITIDITIENTVD